jgi:hypothetical protein
VAGKINVSAREVYRLLKGERNPSAETARNMIRAGAEIARASPKAMCRMMISRLASRTRGGKTKGEALNAQVCFFWNHIG